MYPFLKYPFVRFTIFLIVGIVFGLYFQIEPFFTGCIFFILCITYFVLVLFKQKIKILYFNTIIGIVGASVLILFGSILLYFKNDLNNSEHFMYRKGRITHTEIVLISFHKAKKGWKAEALTQRVRINGNWERATGKLLVYISDTVQFEYGDKLVVKATPEPIPPPLNPNAYDYRAYLCHKNIFHRIVLKDHNYERSDCSPPSLPIMLAQRASAFLSSLLRKNIKGQKEFGIASALFLGIREEIDPETSTSYAAAGVTHILAVSGMHVALIFQLLIFATSFISFLNRRKTLLYALLLLFIWFYALITGLSPSVLRAAVMFSFILVGKAFDKEQNIYNTLAASAFLLLCIDPLLLTDVGFQLSYLAVLGIVYIVPKISNPSNKVASLVAASIAAQIATFPLSMYYFHQFPVYFLPANLVIIPLGTVAMYSGIAMFCFSFFPPLASVFGFITEKCLWLMNLSTDFIGRLPYAVLKDIDFLSFEAFGMYAIFLLIAAFFHYKKLSLFGIAVVGVVVLSIFQLSKDSERGKQKLLVIYRTSDTPHLGFFEGSKGVLVSESITSDTGAAFNFNIKGHFIHRGIRQKTFLIPQEATHQGICTNLGYGCLFVKSGKKILWVFSPLPKNIFFTQRTFVDYVIVSNNALKDTGKLRYGFEYRILIADASNYRNIIRRLKEQSFKNHESFYDISTQGAFIKNL